MLRLIIVSAAVVVVPIGIYVASKYGTMEEVTFERARVTAASSTESEQAPKALIPVTIILTAEQSGTGMIVAKDSEGKEFNLSFTGSEPTKPLLSGTSVRFVGHVHDGPNPYFHATQVYE
ncbi:MAG: hypothetical protein MUC47_02210 [Candidatus Kapabacteria bacterium]|jgi:hypothetical protein|nr:hypothetical protein [Candidatus Kapabacteria bacterium]